MQNTYLVPKAAHNNDLPVWGWDADYFVIRSATYAGSDRTPLTNSTLVYPEFSRNSFMHVKLKISIRFLLQHLQLWSFVFGAAVNLRSCDSAQVRTKAVKLGTEAHWGLRQPPHSLGESGDHFRACRSPKTATVWRILRACTPQLGMAAQTQAMTCGSRALARN